MKKQLLFIFLLQLCLSGSIFAISRSVCPLPGQGATFCNLNVGNFCVTGDAQVGGTLNVNGLINGTDISVASGNVFFGNTCRVDQVNGSDALGNRNGAPFKTISAALAVAQPFDAVWVFPGNYNETITVPANVSLRGLAAGTVFIQQLGVTVPTDLVTMGTSSSLEEVNLILTAAADVQLRGIVLPGSAVTPVNIRESVLIIDNTAAGLTTSNVYGIYYAAAGNPAFVDLFITSSISIITNGTGITRGILVDKPNQFVMLSSSAASALGSNAIAIETTHPLAVVIANTALLGGATADISQVAGSIGLSSANLENSTANGLGFGTLIKPSAFIFGNTDIPIGANQTLWMRPGSSGASSVPITIPASQKFLAKSLTVRAIVPPGPGESTTITVQKQTPLDLAPVDTPLTLTLTDMQTEANIQTISVHFHDADLLAVKIVTSLNAMTGDLLASVNVY